MIGIVSLLTGCNFNDTIDSDELPSEKAVTVSSTEVKEIVVNKEVQDTLPQMDLTIETSTAEETENQTEKDTTVNAEELFERESEIELLKEAANDDSVRLMLDEIKDSYELNDYGDYMPNNPFTVEDFRLFEPEFAINVPNSAENIVGYVNMMATTLEEEIMRYDVQSEATGLSLSVSAILRDGRTVKLAVVDLLTYGEYEYISIGG